MNPVAQALTFTLSVGAIAFSQEMPRRIDTIFCYDISHSGFVAINEEKYTDIFFKLKDNLIFEAPFSINIEGTITSIDNEIAKLQDINGKKIGIPVIGIVNTEPSINKINRMKVVSIKDYKVNNSQGTDSLMHKAFDPQRVYIPRSMNVNTGDHISITKYSAILADTCYVGEDSRQKAFVFGKFKKL